MRGQRCSALCGFDIEGFVGWYITKGTFDSERFVEGVKQTVIPYIEPFPGKRSVVILDNAKIHHCDEFAALVRQAGGIVLFTPPYCFDCTPLDNGAFGKVRQYIMKEGSTLNQVQLERALQRALEEAVQPRDARRFFRQCMYLA